MPGRGPEPRPAPGSAYGRARPPHRPASVARRGRTGIGTRPGRRSGSSRRCRQPSAHHRRILPPKRPPVWTSTRGAAVERRRRLGPVAQALGEGLDLGLGPRGVRRYRRGGDLGGDLGGQGRWIVQGPVDPRDFRHSERRCRPEAAGRSSQPVARPAGRSGRRGNPPSGDSGGWPRPAPAHAAASGEAASVLADRPLEQAPSAPVIATAAIRIIFFESGAFISRSVLCHHGPARKGG